MNLLSLTLFVALIALSKQFDKDFNEISAPTDVAVNGNMYYVQITIAGTDNYKDYDSGYLEYIIEPRSINDEDVEIGTIDDIQYTMYPLDAPVPTITYKGISLVLDKDFNIKYYDSEGNEITEIIDAGD